MYRGTTPRLTFKFNNNINLDAFDQIWVTLVATKGISKVEVTFDKDDLIIDTENQQIKVDLTQEQTLSFASHNRLQVQIRFFIDGDPTEAYATNIVYLVVNDILKDGVISNDTTG